MRSFCCRMETKEICEKIIKSHNGSFLKGERNFGFNI